MPISKILVANRSEIAIRIFRAANELDIRTVAIWAEEDKYSLHRFKADESYPIGRGPHLAKDMGPIESYLSIEEVMRVAKLSGADAIHPGYGLLSESPEFAEACAENGIVFIGPKPETMRRLGNKVAARKLAIEIGVPVVPATGPLPDDPEAIKALAADVGYPVMLKASWGGGGRGMRSIRSEADLLRELRVRNAPVLGQCPEDAAVDLVDLWLWVGGSHRFRIGHYGEDSFAFTRMRQRNQKLILSRPNYRLSKEGRGWI